ncbi:hypothetical protein GGS23DRAFT_560978 [Durotheca rogersii]|uniref:uncharacterized protein n=1 Tax=Durotheca rogersii TaxID=419775 RepID=UPI00221F718B|nr:uncharacterized protein GGS23DRAFT_560978 [Durotheca rogersii]KAI5864601.1 hypothetical protein GGS23DRAFT_560978 [Durotheca rogersii]
MMLPRKRARPNPSDGGGNDAHKPATRPSRAAARVASLEPSEAAPAQAAPPRSRRDPDATTTADSVDTKQVRKSPSWYGSWPRAPTPKSSASTQVSHQTIMGGTLRPGAAADLSRYESKRSDSPAGADARSIRTMSKMSETVRPSEQQDNESRGRLRDENKSGESDRDTDPKDQTQTGQNATASSNNEPPPTETPILQPQASSGWLGWFSRPSAPDVVTPKDEALQDVTLNDQNIEVDSPKEPESAQPNAAQPEPEQAPRMEPAEPTKSTTSWFGFWYSSTAPPTPDDPAQTAIEAPSAQDPTPKETQDVVMEDAPPPKRTETGKPAASSTWAFWSRDTGQKDSAKAATVPEPGELAIIGDGSEAHPRRSTSLEINGNDVPPKETSVKAPKETAVKAKRSKRVRPQSMDIDEALPRPETPQSDMSAKTAPLKSTTVPGPGRSSTQNLLLPSFRSTYRMKDNPSIIKQITQLLLRIQQPPGNHVFLVKEPPRIKKAVAIGIHGLFPAAYLRPMIGQPTGTSIRFANHCAEAIRRWADSHGCGDCEIEKIALEGEGKIADRVDNLWKLLLNWIDHIRRADLIVLACHSQGVPVGLMLLEKLINLEIITRSRVGVCAMAGVSLGPFPDYKSGMGMLMGTAAELWQFADPESEISKRYQHALEAVIGYGARVTYIGSIDDQLVPMESAIYSPASHPYICRAVFIDGRIHAPDFIAHLVGFALKLRNLGISDHGLIRELSVPLAGSLYSGEGHSRLYDDEQVYDLAISHALETTNVSGVPCRVHKQERLANPNPFMLPWIMRGLLEEEFVRTELYSETVELLQQFDDWSPTTKALKDVKYRLEAVRSKL